NLFTLLLQLMTRYCRGDIVEGVEPLEAWREVQRSPAFAAQGYFLSRPVPLISLEEVILALKRQTVPEIRGITRRGPPPFS
ncbi:hypothetical protein AIZ20_23665, partial [Salmonella enterica subsp. enterica serovar Typhimurium]